jgi:alkanesulfonate monooxygenase SsuD/methylene tetrahydromethanopterin reductase-like flavin-dependent oxidoreductase (luciferase family)
MPAQIQCHEAREGEPQAARSRTEVIINLARRDKPTLRQLLGYLAGARGYYATAGTPDQIADFIGLVPGRCGRRVQYHAATAAGATRRV